MSHTTLSAIPCTHLGDRRKRQDVKVTRTPRCWVARRNTDSSSNIQHRNTLASSHTGRLWQAHLFTADPQSHCISCAVSAWQERELFPALPRISFCDAEKLTVPSCPDFRIHRIRIYASTHLKRLLAKNSITPNCWTIWSNFYLSSFTKCSMTHCINKGRVCQASAYRTAQTNCTKVLFMLCEQKTKPLNCLG